MFLLRMESDVTCLKASVDDYWLGYKNFGSLSLIQRKNFVRGFYSCIEPNNKIYEIFAIGKQHKDLKKFLNGYIKEAVYVGSDFITLCLYVDDLIFMSTLFSLVKEFKEAMKFEFEMSDLREM